MEKSISFLKPFLPPEQEYLELLNDIWSRNWLTNNGPLVRKLEQELVDHLGLEHLLFVNNGTTALQLAIRALDLTGEIITTPLSYVATTSSIVWEHCTPVYVDVDAETLNIDPSLIEAAITDKTSAILATHLYGNPCDIKALESLARKHHLKLIFDAAHCFGTRYRGRSVLDYGDISCISFHATKIYHTVEGGAVVCDSADLLRKMAYLRNFGHDGPYRYNGIGINGKNSEFHAAMGICNLRHVGEIADKRKADSLRYDSLLTGAAVRRPRITEHSEYNYAYYPLIFQSEPVCIRVFEALEADGIYTRRYFYPSLSRLDYVEAGDCPVADDLSRRILCLPLYFSLSDTDIERICHRILQHLQ